MPLVDTSLRFALDQSNRTPLPNVGTDADVVIWKGEPVEVQASLFLGDPTISSNFVSDISNISSATLTIRKYTSTGLLLAVKTLTSPSADVDPTTTFATWQNGTKQHFTFRLTSSDTNLVLPSDGALNFFGSVSINTDINTTITVGTFRGVFRSSGTPGSGETPTPTTQYYTKTQIDAGFQPLRPNLTSIAALTTTTYGLGLLTKVDGAAVRSYIGATAFDGLFTSLNFTSSNLSSLATRNFADIQNTPTTIAGYGITNGVITTDSRLSDSRVANAIRTATTKNISTLSDPLDGQALVYDEALGQWRPGTVSGGGGGGGGGSPGGSSTQIQFNNGGFLGGISYLTYDGTSVFQIAGNRYNVVDPTDTSKRFQFDISNVATGNTRVVNVPDANSTTVQSKTAGLHKWFSAMSAQGIFTDTQPAFSDISGSLASSQMPALTGDVTASSGSTTTTVTNLPTGVAMAGYLSVTNIVAPATPSSGLSRFYVDSTSKNFCVKNDGGIVNHGVQSLAAVSSRWIRSISDDGSVTATQPTEADVLFSDVTTGNATTGAHGFCPKFPGGTSTFLRADGAFAVPPTGGTGGRPLFAGTSDNAIVSTTAEQSIVPTGVGSVTLPANYLFVGKTLRITAAGVYSTTGQTSMSARLRIGSVLVSDNNIVSTTTLTNEGWALELFITCRTTGNSGTIYSQGVWSDFTGYNKIGMKTTAPTTIDTTIPLMIDITMFWTVASSSITVKTTDFIIDTPSQDGAPGTAWRSGDTFPSNSVGLDGDFYLYNVTGDVYVRSSGVYNLSTNIKGPSGGVTSVGLSMPSIFSVTNSPVTTTGTLTSALALQSANRLFAGPSSGSDAAPTFRALVANDIPSLDWSKITSGTPTTLAGYGITDGATTGSLVHNTGNESIGGIKTFTSLPVWPNQSANIIFAGPQSGGSAGPTFRSLVLADLPSSIPNANLANSAITIQGNSVSLGGSTLSTTATPQFRRLGLNQPADSTNLFAATATTDGITLFSLKRATDSGPTGKFMDLKNAAGTTLWSVDIAGVMTGSVAWSSVTGTPTTLAGYGITDAGSNTTATAIQTLSSIGIQNTVDPTNGQVLVFDSGLNKWTPGTVSGGGGGGSGTVTSVNMTVPSWLAVSGVPLTTSGTIAVTTATGQTANRVLATPSGSTGALGLRQIVEGDVNFTDVTTGNASATAHGFLPKLSNNTNTVLRGDGTFTMIGNGALTNSSVTLSAGSNVGLTMPGAVSLGATGVIGSTSDNIRFGSLGLGVAAPGNGRISTTLGVNNVTGLTLKRFTDTSPTGRFVDYQNAAGTTLYAVDINGAVTVGAWHGSTIDNAYLTNSGITLAGTAMSLGDSISRDTILGLSTVGLVKRSAANTLVAAVAGTDYSTSTSTEVLSGKTLSESNNTIKPLEAFVIAVGDEITAITTGTAKVAFRMPYAFTLTAIRSSLTVVSTSGNPTVNVKESGTTIFSTTLSIDANEKTSTTAATAAVLSDTTLADDAEITIDIDTAGTGAKGLKVYFIGYRT